MLPKINRLKKTSDFKAAFRHSKLIKGAFLDMRVAPTNHQFCRFGIIVSLKVSKKATERNRIKRQLTQIFCSFLPLFKKGQDFLITAKSSILDKNYQQINEEIGKIIKNAKLIS